MGDGGRTARIRYSIVLEGEERLRVVERAAAQVVVSSVVVLFGGDVVSFCVRVYKDVGKGVEGWGSYSFAKTPLKAAHAPLAAARGIQGIFGSRGGLRWGDGDGDGGGDWGMALGIRGSVGGCMVGCVVW